MPREFGKVWFSLFTDDDFTNQPRLDKLLYVALIGQPSLNSAGLLPINLKRWRKACRDGDRVPTEMEIKAALIRMERRRYAFCDDDTGEALVRSFIRSDKVDKQPNVLINAFRCVGQVESPKLAHVLQGELARITVPEVNGAGAQAAKLRVQLPLVHADAVEHLATLTQGRGPYSEPFAEDFPEGLHEPSAGPSEEPSVRPSDLRGSGRGSGRPPVVVEVGVDPSPTADGYVSKEREHGANFLGAPRESSTPPPPDPEADDPEPPADKRRWSRPAADLVDATIPRDLARRTPKAILVALRINTSRLLNEGIPSADVRGGLSLWATEKSHLGPNLLPSLVSEYQRAETKPRVGTASTKSGGWLDIAKQAADIDTQHQKAIGQ